MWQSYDYRIVKSYKITLQQIGAKFSTDLLKRLTDEIYKKCIQ